MTVNESPEPAATPTAESTDESGAAREERRPADVAASHPVVSTQVIHQGKIWDLASDEVDLGGEGPVVREYVLHPGAVAVIALDDRERVLLLHQYRHPVRSKLWEPPAGILDNHEESLQEAAARELAEEADLLAGRWDVLADYFTTPGSSDEAIRVFLARDLSSVPQDERHERTDEERDMEAVWVPLEDALAAVLAGRIGNPSAVVGILAVAHARASGWQTLRPLDAPWVR